MPAHLVGLHKKPKTARGVAPKAMITPEEELLILVGEGKVNNVKLFLEKHTKDEKVDFSTSCVNFKNNNAMDIAIEMGNWEMIRYLSTVMKISKRRMLLKAIHEGDLNLVEKLCEEMLADDDNHDYDETEQELLAGEEKYSPNMTPLMLAAVDGHFEIIGYLIERGHYLTQPHPPSCLCMDHCLPRLNNSDKLELSLFTFCQYSAMSSPQYIVHITNDPIYYAFKIHDTLITLSDIERPFKKRYEQLAQNVREFAAGLIGECINANEIEIVLNEKETTKHFLKSYVPSEIYPRLLMAMEYNQKEFVTHPKLQLFLQDKFYGAFADWRYYSNISKLVLPIIRLFTFPSALFNITFYPSSSAAMFYAAPLNRMLHFLVFYIVFLGVLLMESLREKPRYLQQNMSSVWTLIIIVYFCTLSGSFFHQILVLRPARFIRNGWNIFDVVMLAMFGMYLAFNLASIFRYAESHIQGKERRWWNGNEPQLVAEGFLVIASVLAYLKLMFFLQAHATVGPLQVALGHIIKACARYSFFDVIILLAFTTAFSKYYSYYQGMKFQDPDSREVSYQEQSFVSWMSSFKTFFWAMFTQTDPAVADVVVENLNQTGHSTISCNDHAFTEFVGYVGLGSFSLLIVLVIVNMVIAAMSETYANILKDVHKSWLFVRTEIYIYFMNFPIIPPPFNFIPHSCKIHVCHEKADLEEARAALRKTPLKIKYQELMKCLVYRYFCSLKRRNMMEDKLRKFSKE